VRRTKEKSGKKIGLDYDLIDKMNPNTKQLIKRILEKREMRTEILLELRQAEAEGKTSKAKKLRREYNQSLEITLYLERQWCSSCSQSLLNCHCDDPSWEPPVVRERVQEPEPEVQVRVVRYLAPSGPSGRRGGPTLKSKNE
jgi:hypothetical protein